MQDDRPTGPATRAVKDSMESEGSNRSSSASSRHRTLPRSHSCRKPPCASSARSRFNRFKGVWFRTAFGTRPGEERRFAAVVHKHILCLVSRSLPVSSACVTVHNQRPKVQPERFYRPSECIRTPSDRARAAHTSLSRRLFGPFASNVLPFLTFS